MISFFGEKKSYYCALKSNKYTLTQLICILHDKEKLYIQPIAVFEGACGPLDVMGNAFDAIDG